MKAVLRIGVVSLLIATGAHAQDAGVMAPAEAIAAAAARPEDGVKGTFEFVVKGVGEVNSPQGRIVYLNSEQDYRIGANLSVQVMTSTVKALEQQLGGPLTQTAIGKRVVVDGVAKQAKIAVAEEKGEKPFGYYFQTRITVKSTDQLKVL